MRATIHHGRWLACKITTNLNNYTTFSKPISFATSRSLVTPIPIVFARSAFRAVW